MNALSVTVLLCLAVTAYGFPNSKIVGGKDAPPGMFPYQVSLREYGNHFCGGSIISNRDILTAAHCVDGTTNLESVSVHVGTNLLSEQGEKYGVEKILMHPRFNTDLLTSDVALITVNQSIVFNANVKAIPLSTQTTREGSKCVLSGWGSTHFGGHSPNHLQYADLLVGSQARCKKTHVTLADSNICTFTHYGQGACHGDSGGPLVANGQQIGIVSYGQPCAVGEPDVYTRVSSFIPWIQQNTHSLVKAEEVQADEVQADEVQADEVADQMVDDIIEA